MRQCSSLGARSPGPRGKLSSSSLESRDVLRNISLKWATVPPELLSVKIIFLVLNINDLSKLAPLKCLKLCLHVIFCFQKINIFKMLKFIFKNKILFFKLSYNKPTWFWSQLNNENLGAILPTFRFYTCILEKYWLSKEELGHHYRNYLNEISFWEKHCGSHINVWF